MAVNPECKFLLLKHAFEDWGAVRVELGTDSNNAHSQPGQAPETSFDMTTRNLGLSRSRRTVLSQGFGPPLAFRFHGLHAYRTLQVQDLKIVRPTSSEKHGGGKTRNSIDMMRQRLARKASEGGRCSKPLETATTRHSSAR